VYLYSAALRLWMLQNGLGRLHFDVIWAAELIQSQRYSDCNLQYMLFHIQRCMLWKRVARGAAMGWVYEEAAVFCLW